MIIIVSGLPGSGKSFFAEQLAKKLDAAYVNSDRLRKELFPKRTYSDDEKVIVYKAMLKRMAEATKIGRNIVLDATFHKKNARELFTMSTKEKINFIEVWADEPIIKERLEKSRPYSEADFQVHQLIRQQWEPIEENHLRLQSTNDNIDGMLQKAAKYLSDDTKGNR
jgi:predicted kinase